MNPNNITSQYYDLVSSPLRSAEITDDEIALVNRLIEPGSNILDVGAGTGRHAIPLAKQGYKVTAIDSGTEMLKVLKDNDSTNSIEIIDKSVFIYNPSKKFDLIQMFWNSFNEIALTKKGAFELLDKLKTCLMANGIILINIDDANAVDPSSFHFDTLKIEGEYTYKMNWETFKYSKNTNTSVSKEEIEIYKNDKLIDTKTTYIKQRYWSLEQITDIAEKCGLNIENIQLKTSNELYLKLTLNK